MKYYLQKRILGEILSKSEAQEALSIIARGEANNSHITSFLTTYMIKSITANELEGFRDAMLDLALTVDLSEFSPMDVCGTGGDGKDTFNSGKTWQSWRVFFGRVFDGIGIFGRKIYQRRKLSKN
jgi:anthranilate phosphoribosyltransferase